MKNKRIIKSRNIYSLVFVMFVLVGSINIVYGASSYSNDFNSDQQNNDNSVIIQESNPNSAVNDIINENNNNVNSAAVLPNSLVIQTTKIFSASSLILGAKEVPRVSTNSFAIGNFLIDPQANKLTYNIMEFNLQNETKLEVRGPTFSNTNSNDVLFSLSGSGPIRTGVWNYPQSIETDLLKGRLYINILTNQHPNGEIRGHIVLSKVYIVRTSTNPNPIPSNTFNVNIDNLTYLPSVITIKKGDIVKWTNNDATIHTVTSDNGTELKSVNIPPGFSYIHKFNTVGTYTYHCKIHPEMHGTVMVVN